MTVKQQPKINQSLDSEAQNFEADEFNNRIRAYQDILRENEQTIEKFRHRVLALER